MDPLVWPVESATDGAVPVGITTTEVLAANPRRADAVFVNDSNQPIYLARGNDAVLHQGIRLNANGGNYEINASNLFLGAINAIAEGGAKVLTVSEGI
ncbi:unnamed protein product [marine sediment metagenome]|uniref:Uncharacterized protein n=1 Tax=marine sediment metagenome TaxID=412755 RepID=X0YG23_9ZZZZ